MKENRTSSPKAARDCDPKAPPSATATAPLTEEEVLARRLELAAGGIPIGITNKAGTPGDKCAHYSAMPGGPSTKYPDRPKGPGPNDRGAQYYSTTDPKIIEEWTKKYPGCNTFIGGFLPDDVCCLDIDRIEDFKAGCPGLFEKLKAAGFPVDKRKGKERYHIWVLVPMGHSASDLPGCCIWGEIKWSGSLVVSSPSHSYESITPLSSWENIPRLSKTDFAAIKASKATKASPSGGRAQAGRHPHLVQLSARLAVQKYSREAIIDAVWAADLASGDPAQHDPHRPGDFAAEVERMVDGAVEKYGIGSIGGGNTAIPIRPAGGPSTSSLPVYLMEVGGLAGKIADHINSQAMIKNPELAFWAGIIAVSHTCGRRIETETGLDPGLGVVALAPSSSGKEIPQAILSAIFAQTELSSTIVRKIASGQGLEDFLNQEPKILLMVDEAMHMFRSMADPRLGSISPEPILKELLSGKKHYTGRALAKFRGKFQKPVNIERPHLTFFGLAVPSEFFDAFNQQMVRGGLFGRLICPVISPGPLVIPAPFSAEVPQKILECVRQWDSLDFAEWDENEDPTPIKKVGFTPKARNLWNDYRITNHKLATQSQDEVGSTLWGRSAEKAARLALIRAASREGPQVSEITHSDIEWSCEVVDFYTTQMISMAGNSISSNEVERKRKKFLEVMRTYLGKHPGAVSVPHSHVLKYSKFGGRDCHEIAADLSECGDILIHRPGESSNGKHPIFYGFPDPNSQIHPEIHGHPVNLDNSPKAQ